MMSDVPLTPPPLIRQDPKHAAFLPSESVSFASGFDLSADLMDEDYIAHHRTLPHAVTTTSTLSASQLLSEFEESVMRNVGILSGADYSAPHVWQNLC